MAGEFATANAERAASERSALCPECERAWGQDHAPDCVLRPIVRYQDYLRELRATDPEIYWGQREEYLS